MKGRWDDSDDDEPPKPVVTEPAEKTHKKKKAYLPTCPEYQTLLSYSLSAPPCRSVDLFKKLSVISEGTYGIVYKAQNKETGEVVALKRLKFGENRTGIPINMLREVKFFLQFRHPNILKVKEVLQGISSMDFFVVMEYVDFDLYDFLQSTTKSMPLVTGEIKTIMHQLIKGIACLHKHNVIHRDLKTKNILLTKDGVAKLADFGSAREVLPSSIPKKSDTVSSFPSSSASSSSSSTTSGPYAVPVQLTAGVTTPLYRAPEMALGAQDYTAAVDMFALGCIFAELYEGHPFLAGRSEPEILASTFSLLGHPDEHSWPGFSRLPDASRITISYPGHSAHGRHPPSDLESGRLRLRLSRMTNSAFDLLTRLLALCPARRITAAEALEHPFFKEEPLPQDHLDLSSSHFATFLEHKRQAEEAAAASASSSSSSSYAASALDETPDASAAATPATPGALGATPTYAPRAGAAGSAGLGRASNVASDPDATPVVRPAPGGGSRSAQSDGVDALADELFDAGFLANATPDTLAAVESLKQQWRVEAQRDSLHS